MPTSRGAAEGEEIPELVGYPPIMTVQQVAEVLQVNDQVVRRRLNEGAWPGFRAGSRDWRIRRLAVRAIILGDDTKSATSDQVTPDHDGGGDRGG